jgi:hypothetical protein
MTTGVPSVNHFSCISWILSTVGRSGRCIRYSIRSKEGPPSIAFLCDSFRVGGETRPATKGIGDRHSGLRSPPSADPAT